MSDIVTLNGYKIKDEKAVRSYDTVALMKADTKLKEGYHVKTKGYYEANDGGHGEYVIVDDDTLVDDGGSIHALTNGLRAKLIIDDVINFKQFGAKGDGINNDYQVIKKCCDYANNHNLLINNLNGNYYIDGEQITLNTSVKNTSEVTFTLGNSYARYNSLFKFQHDTSENVTNVTLSTIFTNRNTVTTDYREKSFLLDTKIAYGERLDGTDPDETIVEPFNCHGQYERIWYDDYDDTLTVDVKNISDSNEKGYSFIGGNVRQKDSSSFGTSLLTVSRNNCIIKDLNIDCSNTSGNNAVVNVDNGNNCLLENIYCGSVSDGWGYDIGLYNVANVKTINITGVYNGKPFGNRTVKNWLLKDSVVALWDIHWNAYGFLTIEDSIINRTIQIGYGTGILNVKNSYALWIETRNDYMQIFNGEIIVENSYLNDGIHIRSTYSDDDTRDDFFNNFKLPNLILKNSIRKYSDSLQDLYINIPSEVADLITTKGRILFDNVDFIRLYYQQRLTATKEIYDSIVRDCKHFTTTMNTVLDSLGTCIGVGSNTNNLPNVTPNTIFNDDFTSVCKRNGNVVSIRCEGTLNQTVTENNYKLADVTEILKPNVVTYGILIDEENIYPCYIGVSGQIRTKATINSGTKIVMTIQYILD